MKHPSIRNNDESRSDGEPYQTRLDTRLVDAEVAHAGQGGVEVWSLGVLRMQRLIVRCWTSLKNAKGEEAVWGVAHELFSARLWAERKACQ